jgi:hypothetical protein
MFRGGAEMSVTQTRLTFATHFYSTPSTLASKLASKSLLADRGY